jgi:parallel beta-helix repeat protein
MSKNIALILALITLTTSCLVIVQPVKAQFLNIHIKTDGSIVGTEGTDGIQRIGDTYLFKNSINGSIFVEKDNVTIDGAGYSLHGSGSGTGIGLMSKTDRLGYGGVTIKNLQIKGFSTGIRFSSSSNNIMSRVNITDCFYGISILSSSNNVFSGNYLHNNTIGIEFVYSPNNVLTNNRLDSNGQPLWFEADWINSIDPSNTINGKPVYFFVNQKDLLINPSAYPEIGYLAFVNCTQITVNNLDFSNSRMGIIIIYTTNSTITQNKITNTWRGIYLYGSYGNNITENYLANNQIGIYVETNNANTITRNEIRNSREFGIALEGANQIIYYNNFINNSKHATSNGWYDITSAPLPWGVHIWDNGSVGNYWSDYNGTDSDHDGIGDVPYVLSQERGRNNTDRYPLMELVEVIPEFSFLILPLFMIAIFLMAILYKRKVHLNPK